MPVTSASSTRTSALRRNMLRSAGRDLARREQAGGDLVEQRLEQVVVGAVDQRDLGPAAGQDLRRPDAAEAAADDHHAMSWRLVHGAILTRVGPKIHSSEGTLQR